MMSFYTNVALMIVLLAGGTSLLTYGFMKNFQNDDVSRLVKILILGCFFGAALAGHNMIDFYVACSNA